MKTIKSWGKKVKERPTAQAEANQRQPPQDESKEKSGQSANGQTRLDGNGQTASGQTELDGNGQTRLDANGQTRLDGNGQTARKRRVLTSRSRGALARLVYEDMSSREAGTTVSKDIAGDPTLKKAMYGNQYRPKRELYSPRQMSILLKHYSGS